jgi:hypothetical protein
VKNISYSIFLGKFTVIIVWLRMIQSDLLLISLFTSPGRAKDIQRFLTAVDYLYLGGSWCTVARVAQHGREKNYGQQIQNAEKHQENHPTR